MVLCNTVKRGSRRIGPYWIRYTLPIERESRLVYGQPVRWQGLFGRPRYAMAYRTTPRYADEACAECLSSGFRGGSPCHVANPNKPSQADPAACMSLTPPGASVLSCGMA